MRSGILLTLALTILATPAIALTEPPIQGKQDSDCRDEARARLFSTPDPQHVGLFETGKRIYEDCMARSAAAAKGGRTAR